MVGAVSSTAEPLRPVAIVTGASSGIGAATAIVLAEHGFDVALTYRSGRRRAASVAEAARAAGAQARAFELDVADVAAVDDVVADVATTLGIPTVLVNNAAVNRRRAAVDETVDAWQRVLDVNLRGAWACARAVAQRMIAAGSPGRIVNVTSILATEAVHGGAAYCASKAALTALTQVLALELAASAITVNAVAPGHVATPMNFDAEKLAGAPPRRPVIPVHRAASAREIAEAIAFLVGPHAGYITGSSLLVDGGLKLIGGPVTLQRSVG
jgi:NAD(P)-dependent dehydrogenase (short-subunit alcohol dehydrogenase family)